MPLAALAAELLLTIAEELPLHDVSSLLRTNRRLNTLLTPHLYTRAKTLLVPAPPRGGVQDPEPLLNNLARLGRIRSVTHLLNAGASPTIGAPPALYTAAEAGQADMVSLMIAHHTARTQGVAVCRVACQTYNSGRSPLHIAAQCGHDATVRVLLEADFSVMQQTEDGATPLVLAITNAHVQVVQTLLEYGASPNVDVGGMAVSAARRKPLIHWIVKNAFVLKVLRGSDLLPILRLLIDYGADVDSRDGYRATPLHSAAKSGDGIELGLLLQSTPESKKAGGKLVHSQIVALLIERGADVNARDQGGRTPLHNAAEFQDVEMVRMLLEAGAKRKVLNGAGKTPVWLASANVWPRGSGDIVKLLEDCSIGPGE